MISPDRPRLVTDLPDPPELTDADLDRLYRQAREWARMFEEKRKGLDERMGLGCGEGG